MSETSRRPVPRTGARLLLLLALFAGGAVVGGLGAGVTGNPAWWLAIPVAVAAGWLFVADPTACVPPAQPVARSSDP